MHFVCIHVCINTTFWSKIFFQALSVVFFFNIYTRGEKMVSSFFFFSLHRQTEVKITSCNIIKHRPKFWCHMPEAGHFSDQHWWHVGFVVVLLNNLTEIRRRFWCWMLFKVTLRLGVSLVSESSLENIKWHLNYFLHSLTKYLLVRSSKNFKGCFTTIYVQTPKKFVLNARYRIFFP